MPRLIITSIGVTAALIIVLGCGSGEEEAALSKSQFVRQARPICAKLNEERAKAFTAAVEGDQKEAFAEVIIPSLEHEAEELEALGAPPEARPMIEKLSAATEVLADEGLEGANDPVIQAYKSAASDLGLANC